MPISEGNLVGRLPPRGEPDVFQQAVKPLARSVTPNKQSSQSRVFVISFASWLFRTAFNRGDARITGDQSRVTSAATVCGACRLAECHSGNRRLLAQDRIQAGL